MIGAVVIQGPWANRLRCDGCAQTYPEGHIVTPIYFRDDPTPFQLCFGCFEGDRSALLQTAQRARKRARGTL